MGGLGRALALPRDLWLRLSPWSRTWLPRGLAAIGFALLAKTLLDQGIQGAGGRGGFDAAAYWAAASNVRDGQPLYTLPWGEYMANPYPPILGQALVPLSYLSLGAFVWVWRAIELVALRVATGSWTGAGLAILFLPPVLAELDAGNVHLIMAAACALVMRGHGAAVAPAAVLKFATVPLAPLAWRLDRRGLLVGGAVAAAALALSYVADPRAWSDYASFLGRTTSPTVWYNLAEDVPIAIRLGVAFLVGVAAIRWIRLAPLAVLLAYPAVWFHAISTLVAAFGPIAALPAPATPAAPATPEAERRGPLVPEAVP